MGWGARGGSSREASAGVGGRTLEAHEDRGRVGAGVGGSTLGDRVRMVVVGVGARTLEDRGRRQGGRIGVVGVGARTLKVRRRAGRGRMVLAGVVVVGLRGRCGGSGGCCRCGGSGGRTRRRHRGGGDGGRGRGRKSGDDGHGICVCRLVPVDGEGGVSLLVGRLGSFEGMEEKEGWVELDGIGGNEGTNVPVLRLLLGALRVCMLAHRVMRKASRRRNPTRPQRKFVSVGEAEGICSANLPVLRAWQVSRVGVSRLLVCFLGLRNRWR